MINTLMIVVIILAVIAIIFEVKSGIDAKNAKDDEYYAKRSHSKKVKAFMIHQLYIKNAGKLTQTDLLMINAWSNECANFNIRPSDIRTQLLIKRILKNK